MIQAVENLITEPTDSLKFNEITTFADLFCGIGGFHYAARGLGLECVFACDIDKHCRTQYEANFGMVPSGDITTLRAPEIPNHDILFAGFPCQPFSIIGDMKGRGDARGTLIDEIVRVLEAKHPAVFVLENVRQFGSVSNGTVLERTIDSLNKAGYDVEWEVLNALDFGLPQKRERIILVGFLDDSLSYFHWPKGSNSTSALKDMLEQDPDPRHFVSDAIKRRRHARHKASESPMVWHENKAGNVSSHPFSCALRANASHNYLLVDGERRLTPREQLRLQGFPESFKIVGSDSQVRKQVGNAVPVPMIKAVVREVLNAKNQNSRRLRDRRTVST